MRPPPSRATRRSEAAAAAAATLVVPLSDAEPRARRSRSRRSSGARAAVDGPDPGRERHREGPSRPRDPRRLAPPRIARSSASTRRTSPTSSSRASSSATSAARSPAPSPPSPGCSRSPPTAPPTSTRSPRSRRPRRRSSCACSRRGRSGGWAASRRIRSARGSIVSSRRDLSALVEQGLFRDDFFYRIDVVSVRLPRLAERREDILPLARGFLRRAARASGRPARRFSSGGGGGAAAPRLARQRPRARSTSSSGRCSSAEEPEIRSGTSRWAPSARPRRCSRPAVEKRWTLKQLTDAYIEETLRRAGGNRTLAARRLGVSRKSLWERGKRRKPSELGRLRHAAGIGRSRAEFLGYDLAFEFQPSGPSRRVEGGESTTWPPRAPRGPRS